MDKISRSLSVLKAVAQSATVCSPERCAEILEMVLVAVKEISDVENNYSVVLHSLPTEWNEVTHRYESKNKIKAIKAIRDFYHDVNRTAPGLRDLKHLVENGGVTITGINYQQRDRLLEKLRSLECQVSFEVT